MTYSVKEIFYTLQGEGANAGRPAVFCRFAGCNLWSGREEDRATATCRFCDTGFSSADGRDGGVYPDAESLADTVASHRNASGGPRWVVCTGGEPLLQLDQDLIDALRDRGFLVAVETNGTIAAPPGLDWICVSPKAGAKWTQKGGHELKIVWPQGFDLDELEKLSFDHFFLQPQDDHDPAVRERHLRDTIHEVMNRPLWRLSLQTHKLIGIP